MKNPKNARILDSRGYRTKNRPFRACGHIKSKILAKIYYPAK
jgi:hypothetical protein